MALFLSPFVAPALNPTLASLTSFLRLYDSSYAQIAHIRGRHLLTTLHTYFFTLNRPSLMTGNQASFSSALLETHVSPRQALVPAAVLSQGPDFAVRVLSDACYPVTLRVRARGPP